MSREIEPTMDGKDIESTIDVHREGLPGNEELVAEIEGREQAEISETLSAAEAVDRILAEVPDEEIHKGKLLASMTHLDGHIREIDPSTVEDDSVFPGGTRPEILFAIPQQEGSHLEDGLTAVGFTMKAEDNGLVAEFKGKNVVSFLYSSREVGGEEEDTPENAEKSAA
ncbi:MAG: hypothetical protein HYV34_01880 [Candidatus Kerfeldbacteria bacterium]|nr:hypothetical protein [Candidatus Kerfeldbacteria bacterium]